MTLSFRASIFGLLGISLLITVLIGGIGSYFMLKNASDTMYQHENTIKATMYMEEIKANYWMVHALMLQMALDKDQDMINTTYSTVRALLERNGQLVEQFTKTDLSDPRAASLFQDFQIRRAKYREVLEEALKLDRSTTSNEAIERFNRFNHEQLLPVFYDFIDVIDELNRYKLHQAELENTLNQDRSETAFWTIVGLIVISVAVLLISGYFLSGVVMRLVNRVTGFAGKVAVQDFSDRLEPSMLERTDEFGHMSRSLQLMKDSLQSTISDLSATAAELLESTEAAHKANEYKSVFLARMSHEIRTPLNAIVGMTYIAKRAKDQATVNDSLNKIATSSAHLLGIINDILDMSKIEAGKLELSEDEFGLERLLMNVSTVVSVKTDEKEQNLLFSIDSKLPSRFVGDSLRLSQVLTNLLNNATKFTPQHGTIKLSAELVEKSNLSSFVRFVVEDTGIGLTEEQISRLFTPFEQADTSTSRQFGGTGLGLAICARIVEMMGGDIRVESEFGKGSRFIVTAKLHNSEQYEHTRLDGHIDVQHTKVLIVDQSAEVREFFVSLFNELDIAIATADSTTAALTLLEQNAGSDPFNILFLDWNTAEDEGVEFVKQVKERFGNQVIVVLVSAARFSEIEDKASEAGVNRFLPKPVFPSTVINMVNEIVGAPGQQEVEAATRNADLSGKSILLVEDSEINREIVFAYLENTGVRIDVAENGAEGVEKLIAAKGKYDMVLMDVHMPVMDGYTATRRMREEEQKNGWGRIPIVAMTANAFKEDVDRCIAAGMDDHLPKPMDAEETVEMLEKYLC